jgi:hypothetical protein
LIGGGYRGRFPASSAWFQRRINGIWFCRFACPILLSIFCVVLRLLKLLVELQRLVLEHRLPDQLEQPGEVLVGVVYHFDLYFFFIDKHADVLADQLRQAPRDGHSVVPLRQLQAKLISPLARLRIMISRHQRGSPSRLVAEATASTSSRRQAAASHPAGWERLVTLSLFLAASVGFAAPARAQYNAPNNQYDMQRGQGGGYELPAPQDTRQPLVDTPQQPLDIPSPQDVPEQRQQPLDTPYRIDQGCPSCR